MKKILNPIDVHVGQRVRMRRLMLSMSQEKLADQLGITFQQVQKNERGYNRIGASRLQRISEILEVPVSFFFDGAPRSDDRMPNMPVSAPSPAFITDFLATREGIEIAGGLASHRRPRARTGAGAGVMRTFIMAVAVSALLGWWAAWQIANPPPPFRIIDNGGIVLREGPDGFVRLVCVRQPDGSGCRP